MCWHHFSVSRFLFFCSETECIGVRFTSDFGILLASGVINAQREYIYESSQFSIHGAFNCHHRQHIVVLDPSLAPPTQKER